MKSFDFYDTLMVRLVAEPSGVFQLIEGMLSLPGFTARRRLAEREATERRGAIEITLEDIYAHSSLAADREQGAMKLEQRLEKNLLSPIVENLVNVSDGDLILSDMYLPKSFFQAILSEALPRDRRPIIMVSSDTGKRKSDGRLWQHVIKSGLRPEVHIGDNRVSDVKRPRQLGIPAQHYRTAKLNRFEKCLFGEGLNGNIAAGVARSTRLAARISNNKKREESAALIDAFASVFAPVIVGFVEYVIEDAIRRGLEDIFFLARDGQLPYLVAGMIIEKRSLPLRSHYLFGSRRSLHMAGYTSPHAAATWLLENTPGLSIQDVASRANLPVEIFRTASLRIGIRDLAEPIPASSRTRLIEVLTHNEVADALRQESDRQWKLASFYYRSAGLRSGSSVALVDVGWSGRMQKSLRSILDRDCLAETKIVGYYLCLSSKTHSENNDVLLGYLHDPDGTTTRCPYDPYRPVIEASLSADHGSTTGFRWNGPSQSVPEFGELPSASLREAIALQQETVLRFTELLLRVENETGYRVQWDVGALRTTLLKFLRAPQRKDAKAFASHQIDVEQIEGSNVPLVRSNLDWFSISRGQSLGYWPEGSAALSDRTDLRAFLRLARFLHQLSKRWS